MKIRHFTYAVMTLLMSFILLSCGDDSKKDEPDVPGNGTSTADWSSVSGKYLSRPLLTEGNYGISILEAQGLEVKKNIVFHYPSVSNSRYIVPETPIAFSGFSGGESTWKYSATDWTSFGVTLSGSQLLTMDDNWSPTGGHLDISKEGIEYNGVIYYRPEVFNANIACWISEQKR